MTDQEREVLAADCESAGMNAFYQCKGSFSQSLGAAIRAALAVAERVVREDEREACWNVAIDEMLAAEADVETASDEDLVARLQSQGAASAAGRIATFIQARGSA